MPLSYIRIGEVYTGNKQQCSHYSMADATWCCDSWRKSIKNNPFAFVQDEQNKGEPTLQRTLLYEGGHDVLKRLAFHADLNAIELIWANMKGSVTGDSKNFKMTDIEMYIETAIRYTDDEITFFLWTIKGFTLFYAIQISAKSVQKNCLFWTH